MTITSITQCLLLGDVALRFSASWLLGDDEGLLLSSLVSEVTVTMTMRCEREECSWTMVADSQRCSRASLMAVMTVVASSTDLIQNPNISQLPFRSLTHREVNEDTLIEPSGPILTSHFCIGGPALGRTLGFAFHACGLAFCLRCARGELGAPEREATSGESRSRISLL